MTDLFHNLALGFSVAVSPVNLLLCLIGALVGTLVGVLPGIGTIATVAMLLPITFGLPPVGALIMLAGIYYGAQYGGSTTSILVNIPGEATSVVTTLDGSRWPSGVAPVRRSRSLQSAHSSRVALRPS
jgi:putative tricarboxylic transport membrane protein